MPTFYDVETCKAYFRRLRFERKRMKERHAIERDAMKRDIQSAAYQIREAKAGRIEAPGKGWGD